MTSPSESIQPENVSVDQGKEILGRIKRASGKLSKLRQIWDDRKKEESPWPIDSLILYQTLSETACKLGEPFFAFDVVQEGLKHFPEDRRLRQMQAWAMAQSGATRDAEKLLLSLPMESLDDLDAYGLLGRCYKDFGRMAPTPEERKKFFQKSAETYGRGFSVSKLSSSYLGINAATLFYLIDEKDGAMELAAQALEACRKELKASPDDVWLHATLAELALLLDEPDAESRYQEFRKRADADYGVVFSARKQAHLVLGKKGLPETALDACLNVPPVVVFAGHMIDDEGRKVARFPAQLEPVVREQIKKKVEALDAGIAFSSAASGSDILFLEAMLQRGREYHVVLPLPVGLFRAKCVVAIGGEKWGERFDKVLQEAASVTIANLQDTSLNPTSLDYGNRLVYGMARIRAKTIGSSLKAIAVWNEKPGDGMGGTAACVKAWRERGEDVVILNPFPPAEETAATSPPEMKPAFATEIRAMLFADIVGYSKLNENDMPLYITHFLGELGALVNGSPHRPMTRNTWGDALYFVFDDVQNAGLLALEIQKFVCQPEKWTKLGFSKELSLRTALHAGPVYPILDGITGFRSYCGAHVNRAARIEPITQEGQIFVSEQFAALVEADGIKDFHCDYVGEKELPKKAGIIRAHLLRAAHK